MAETVQTLGTKLDKLLQGVNDLGLTTKGTFDVLKTTASDVKDTRSAAVSQAVAGQGNNTPLFIAIGGILWLFLRKK